ncbi:hypothetical protein [Streptomyces acidiscabies]|uniref:DNA recombination-mediator protein A n=1 Tax=Streptomyces acidiscabies TaxID=42234 RepID=A0AAP6B729_9ACTN|nr:hypothetical protein [Streptomyces acidiscabies]MBP5939852.1 hypothetical protein [Streptomyces sp. LBUM 1476]MBZ3911037.1 hypothetical protein [Streptomyces acidiscabies]MDX2959182.1 hypothetical protein [Streptomyces acidiscabies]MDX3017674.1 hypothetical protein [Streptomyces acidiscabies]MDX3788149.1 hypothetical protein [Streptomyces acidiscabies]
MTTIAVTGHMNLTEGSVPLVREALGELLAGYAGDLVGVSCIAEGADALFAEAVLAVGGRLVVVIPSQDYRAKKVKADHADLFDRLLEAADEIVVMPHETADRHAYEAANAVLIQRAERIVAVWDGAAPTGKGGGTADTVVEARAAGVPVDVVWPQGVARQE